MVTDTGQPSVRRRVEADRVVLAAGALGSTEVLLRSREAGLETSPMPVSYTHLDVYKRQIPSRRSSSAMPWLSADCVTPSWAAASVQLAARAAARRYKSCWVESAGTVVSALAPGLTRPQS